jgi:anti-sigma regulatory factor (Ser/Thr protein kinase)
MVRRIVKQKGYNEKDAFRIETIVDEICNNAVEHGSHGAEGNEINLTVGIDRKKIEISVSNKIDPDKKESLKKMAEYLANPKGAFHETRGRGLALVKMLSNNFQINNSESGTCVQVTKFREE